jgi:hypothetical protein
MAWPLSLADGLAAERGRELPDGTRPMMWPLSVADRAGRRHQADGVAAERGRELPDGTRPCAGRSCWPLSVADGVAASCPTAPGRWRGRSCWPLSLAVCWPIMLAADRGR